MNIGGLSYSGKRVLVVGGATGMGAAAAKTVSALGAEVIVINVADVQYPVKQVIKVDRTTRAAWTLRLTNCNAMANAFDFGLSGGIFPANVGRAFEIATKIRTGSVAINGGGGAMFSGSPFGGIKRSDIGRENGRHGVCWNSPHPNPSVFMVEKVTPGYA